MLQPVIVTQADSCITYALKRIGYPFTIKDAIDRNWLLHKLNNPREFIKVDVSNLRAGDLLISRKKKPNEPLALPVEITSNGRIINRLVPNGGFHTLVCEGGDVVSDYRYQNRTDKCMVLQKRTIGTVIKRINEAERILECYRWLNFK